MLVDGSPRVACVTPLARVAGRRVTTFEGLDDADGWADVMSATGASQCGFCTPGIIVRAASLAPDRRRDTAAVDRMLLAHLCRCTGWQPIKEAIVAGPGTSIGGHTGVGRDDATASVRAGMEGGVGQHVSVAVAAGAGGFSDDVAPDDALVALLAADGEWVVGDSLDDARRRSGKVQGRRSTTALSWPVGVPAGSWVRTLQTTWVEPGYLEPDAVVVRAGRRAVDRTRQRRSVRRQGGERGHERRAASRRRAWATGASAVHREDVVRRGPKRPPLAIAVDTDGGGVLRIAHSGDEDPARSVDVARQGLELAGFAAAPWHVEVVDVAGPPTSVALRASIVGELLAVAASLDTAPDVVALTSGARAVAEFDGDELVIHVHAGDPLDATVLRSYCTGAAHAALGMVRSEAVALDDTGRPVDLTIRSFGILRAQDTPAIRIEIADADRGGEPLAVSDAVFAAALAAAWRSTSFAPRWPVHRR
ncbi:MAG: 2Fe-2S iron-sulfur cluster-binding protein [Ilumatobacteraceae bacterium]